MNQIDREGDVLLNDNLDGGGYLLTFNHKILDNSAAQMVQDLLEYRKEHN